MFGLPRQKQYRILPTGQGCLCRHSGCMRPLLHLLLLCSLVMFPIETAKGTLRREVGEETAARTSEGRGICGNGGRRRGEEVQISIGPVLQPATVRGDHGWNEKPQSSRHTTDTGLQQTGWDERPTAEESFQLPQCRQITRLCPAESHVSENPIEPRL